MEMIPITFLVVLRALAEGRISWAFWPPDSTLNEITSVASEEGLGIWISCDDMDYASEQEPESEEEVDDGSGSDKHSAGSEGSELDGDEESNLDGGRVVAGIGMFDALAIKEGHGEEQDESDG